MSQQPRHGGARKAALVKFNLQQEFRLRESVKREGKVCLTDDAESAPRPFAALPPQGGVQSRAVKNQDAVEQPRTRRQFAPFLNFQQRGVFKPPNPLLLLP